MNEAGTRTERRRTGRAAGFTLIETTLGLALIALIATIALPRVLPDRGETALRIKSYEVAALLRADRNAALRTGRTVATTVDLAGGQIRSGASAGFVVVPAHLPIRQAAGRAPGFRFHADGTASGGRISLGGRREIVVVTVDPLTAAVTITREEADDGL